VSAFSEFSFLNLKNNLQAEEYQKPSVISLGAHYSLLDSP